MSPPRLLVVDDEQSLLLTLRANLELEGIEVATASSGSHALDLIKTQSFDLVLSDVRMPGMNGVDLFREIRQVRPGMPVILMTAYALESLIEEAVQEGAFAVVQKPFVIEQLVPVLLTAARRPTALILDADSEYARAIAESLQAAGIRARAAFDEVSAFQFIHDEAVDVCVIELSMAGSGSPTLISRLKQLDAALSFIALSGHDVPEVLRRLTVNATIGWIRKSDARKSLAHFIATVRAHKVVKK